MQPFQQSHITISLILNSRSPLRPFHDQFRPQLSRPTYLLSLAGWLFSTPHDIDLVFQNDRAV